MLGLFYIGEVEAVVSTHTNNVSEIFPAQNILTLLFPKISNSIIRIDVRSKITSGIRFLLSQS